MKNILNLYLIIFCLFFVAGCSSDDDAATVKLTIIKSDLDMKASGGTGTVEFAATGTVTATVNADWCQVIEVADHKVSISVDANTGYPGRSAQIVLTDGVSTQQATILQEGAIWKYNRDATYFTLTDAAEEVPVEMSSNLPIQVSIPADASQWLSYEMTSDGFVKVTTGIREIEYALLQYDIDDLLGQWTGVVKVVATAFGINQVLSLEENTQIVKNPGGNGYIFQLPMTRLLGATIVLAVTYQDGALVITTPQQQNYALSDGQGGVMYGSIITKTDDGLYLQGKIILSPVLMNDGQVALAYITDAYMSMGLFKGRVPSTANYAGLSIDFPAILMQYAE